MKNKFFNTRTLVTLATLTALGYGLSWLEFPIFPAAPFLKFDFSMFVTLFGGYLFGFPGAVVIELIKQLLIWGTKSSTGGIGEIANFIMGIAFVAVPTVLYRFKKGRLWALAGLGMGCVCQMGVSLLCNRYITFPLFAKYLGMTAGQAFAQLWPYVLGFNAIKSVAIAMLVFFLYKQLSIILKKYVLTPKPKTTPAVAAETEQTGNAAEKTENSTESEKSPVTTVANSLEK